MNRTLVCLLAFCSNVISFHKLTTNNALTHKIFSSFRSKLEMTSDISSSYPKAKLPLKVAVAGAGIGGVYLGYALYSKGFNVTVFEKSSKFSRFGGPIQLASNALSCINSMSPQLFEQIMSRFTFTGNILYHIMK
jgi:ribulose 1,5-bisphosphate synthetase/thiazole synthase